jgi:glycosyltransferase involved in cell wall biosynthesis
MREGAAPWDLVLSSSPPETTHLVARDIARQLQMPWIADYRDSWLDLPHLRLERASVRLKHAAQVRMATRIMRDAAAAITVSEPLARDLRVRHPQLPVHVIENGIDLDKARRAHDRAAGFTDAGRFVVTYTGNFFGVQSPATFLDAVTAACHAEPALADNLLVRFVGGLKPADAARIREGVLAQVVEHEPFLRHDDVLAMQRAADLLMLYVAPGRGSEGVYTGKVFEYVAARRPVLALVPTPNVAGDLLDAAGVTSEHAGGARVAPLDVPGISSALISSWQQWATHRAGGAERVPDVPVPDELLERIDRSAGASTLASVMRGVVQP